MKGVTDITWTNLIMGYILVVIPVIIFRYYRTGLVRDTLTGVLRMTVQLLLVGIYLEFIFRLNNAWLNVLWVLLMLFVTTFTAIRRSELSYRLYFFPVLMALTISVVLIDAFFLGIVIRLDNVLDARYLVPVTGMMLGNSMQNIIIAMNSYYTKLKKEQVLFRFSLANGAARAEALLPYMQEALKKSFNPTIANIAVMGLIHLPGMMTGQILGGSSPLVAIKYQIMIMFTVFIAGILTVTLTINLANRSVFDGYDNLKEGCFRNRH